MSETFPLLPEPLRELRTLAYNLRWSWHEPTRELFARVDPVLWDATRKNPVRLLREVAPDRLATLAGDEAFLADLGEAAASLHRYLEEPGTWWARRAEAGREPDPLIAYFSAEFGVADALPIFAGGLGVLAGDHLKSASDLGIPLVAVGLLYREGYFRQAVAPEGRQLALYEPLPPELLPVREERAADGWPIVVRFPVEDRHVCARIWRADVGRVPLFLLDTDVDANQPDDRRITDRLYGGETEHRLRQEIALGIGGMRALAAMGLMPTVLHLNEGHAAFAAVERARLMVGDHDDVLDAATGRLARSVVFTTHTPVPAGHDHFAPDLLERHLGGYVWELREPWDAFLAVGRRPGHRQDIFCMTTLALRASRRRNGVSRLHGEVTRHMWRELWSDRPEHEVPIGHVTNGVHLATWVSAESQRLFNEILGPAWREEADDMHWHRAIHMPLDRLWEARCRQRAVLVGHARRALAAQVARVGRRTAWTAGALDADTLTIVFARRFATYKRATLLLSDPDRLLRLLTGPRPVQLVFAGKAHPRDRPGQEFLRQVIGFAAQPEVRHRFVFLEDYDVEMARVLVQGADVWLNVPRRPYEASGTSGMKAAANGALNLSIPDGWWAEAWTDHNRLDDPIGWSVDSHAGPADDRDRTDAAALFQLLEAEVVPLFYDRDHDGIPEAWLRRVRSSIRQLAPFFNTHRMVGQYAAELYLPAHWETSGEAPDLEAVAEGA